MTATLRRGACPSLAAPMLTGDGWLARLALVDGLTPAQLDGLARAAARLGNGLVEVTSRGSLQIRGLSADSARELAVAVGELGIAVAAGLPVVTGPLAGLDPAEVADPRPLAAELRRRAAHGLERRLHPKVSVAVDGGGTLHLDALAADVRLLAVPNGWRVEIGDRPAGLHDPAGAVRTCLAALEGLAAGHARAREDAGGPPRRPATDPIGRFDLAGGGFARGLGLPFGQADAAMLSPFAAAAADVQRLRPAPGRALIAVGLTHDVDRALAAEARRLGFIVDADDPRLAVVACSGAPACASANLATRAVAGQVVALRPDLPAGVRLHLSGCPKRCAQPAGRAISLVGAAHGREVTGEGVAVPERLRALLMQCGTAQ